MGQQRALLGGAAAPRVLPSLVLCWQLGWGLPTVSLQAMCGMSALVPWVGDVVMP